jgi:hypothetical protein
MTLVLGRRIDDELIDRSIQAVVGIVVLIGHCGGKPDDSPAVDCHENSESSLWWSFDGRTPRFDHLL